MNERRGAVLVAAMVMGLLLALVGAATAAPPPGPYQACNEGRAKGAGTTGFADGAPFGDFTFTVCEQGPKETDTTGRFTATASKPGAPAPQGNVVCADFDHDHVAFVVALDDRSVPRESAGKHLLLRVTDGGPKPADDVIGFDGPKAAAEFGGRCGLDLSPAGRSAVGTQRPLAKGDTTVFGKGRRG